ncbi:hypothetical protein PTI98_007209 [Pleurotus ostreatus]|nr:hypothetical protein PTI98_010541 [Pleurotus ostreatus]KAJ8694545.1 hypothetical protein PTI98_007209 [Pleurotus ostreatus]
MHQLPELDFDGNEQPVYGAITPSKVRDDDASAFDSDTESDGTITPRANVAKLPNGRNTQSAEFPGTSVFYINKHQFHRVYPKLTQRIVQQEHRQELLHRKLRSCLLQNKQALKLFLSKEVQKISEAIDDVFAEQEVQLDCFLKDRKEELARAPESMWDFLESCLSELEHAAGV